VGDEGSKLYHGREKKRKKERKEKEKKMKKKQQQVCTFLPHTAAAMSHCKTTTQ
jgi:hypothetical protein